MCRWTNDFLYFDEVLLSDIIKELERSYDVKITVADDTLNTIRFYGNFRKREQSIREIMNVLSSTDKMTYTVNGKNIVITLPQWTDVKPLKIKKYEKPFSKNMIHFSW